MKIYLGNTKIGAALGTNKVRFNNFVKPVQTDVTPPAIVGSPIIDQVTSTSFRVTWTLDEGSQGQIEYGTSISYGNFTTKEFDYLTTHVQTISGLTPGTEYHFRILGQDIAGNILTGPDETQTTSGADVTPPSIIVGPDESNITSSSAVITWQLDEAGTGQVEYGLTDSYGETSTLESSFITSHSRTITGLTPNTLYHYRVIGEDAASNSYTGSDQTFTSAETGDTFIPCTPSGGSTYNPTSAADISNPANAGRTAVITNSFSATSTTFAANQDIVPGGGIISGTNINLNGACIQDDFSPLFNSSVTFTSVYENSRLSPEAFGAVGNGSTNDNAAINALINNCSYAIGDPTSTYVKNNPSTYTRAGLFNWNMNGATVEVTSAAGFNTAAVTTDYVFTFGASNGTNNLSVVIFDGIFDCNNVYGRLFRFNGQPIVSVNDNIIRNLYATTTYRCIGVYIDHDNLDNSGIESIEFRRNTIHNLVAEGDGNFNNSPAGVCKAWWYDLDGWSNASLNFTITHEDNVVYDIIGDDAEGFYCTGGPSVNSATWLLNREHYYNCTRRVIKVNCSNFTLQNSTMEEMDNSLFLSAQQVGSMIDFFREGSFIENIVVDNNTIKNRDGQDIHYWLLAFTECRNVTVTDNIFSALSPGNFNGIRLGSNTGSYAGYLENISIQNNTLNNLGFQLMSQYSPADLIDISNNDINYTTTSWNSNTAIIRAVNPTGTRGNIDFDTNTIIINIPSSTSFFNGIIYSAGSLYTNVTINNCTITYANSTITRPFGYIQGNFGNTNTISNTTIIGDVGTEALVVTGATQNPVITNSFGDGATPITVQ